jgi:hypothetical protein
MEVNLDEDLKVVELAEVLRNIHLSHSQEMPRISKASKNLKE